MSIRYATAAATLSAVTLIAALPASAAPVTDYVTFSMTGFTTFPVGGTPPENTVTGAFTITFDPTQILPYTDATAGITLNSLNITAGSAISFCYSAAAYSCDGVSEAAGELVVGGIFSGTALVQYSPATDDYVLHFTDFSSSPVFTEMVYSQVSAGNYDIYSTAASGSVSVTAVAATPLPAALPLFAGGLGVMGFFANRRKRKNAAAIAA
jgi:hypothetical protein